MLPLSRLILVPAQPEEDFLRWHVILTVNVHLLVFLILGHDYVVNSFEILFSFLALFHVLNLEGLLFQRLQLKKFSFELRVEV